MTFIPNREEVERLALCLIQVAAFSDPMDAEEIEQAATVLRLLSARLEELEERDHAVWNLGYASGLSAQKP
jgi:hypothetical protein